MNLHQSLTPNLQKFNALRQQLRCFTFLAIFHYLPKNRPYNKKKNVIRTNLIQIHNLNHTLLFCHSNHKNSSSESSIKFNNVKKFHLTFRLRFYCLECIHSCLWEFLYWNFQGEILWPLWKWDPSRKIWVSG